jgi:hypothetical protein
MQSILQVFKKELFQLKEVKDKAKKGKSKLKTSKKKTKSVWDMTLSDL